MTHTVRILTGHRAGQYGELSSLEPPLGQVYVKLAPHPQSRCLELAQAAMALDDFGAVTMQPWNNLEVV